MEFRKEMKRRVKLLIRSLPSFLKDPVTSTRCRILKQRQKGGHIIEVISRLLKRRLTEM